MSRYKFTILLLINFHFKFIISQNCSHYNSNPNINYCCGHDPGFINQYQSHRLLIDQFITGKNFCDDSYFDKVNIYNAYAIPGDWMMIWYDEFNYSTLDESFYRPDLGWGNIDELHPSSVIRPENIILSNGKLKQIATYDNNSAHLFPSYGTPYGSTTGCYPCPPTHYDYQIGVFSTNMAFPINSRFHANVKMYPNPAKTWPALWLRGDHGIEIDMFEMVDLIGDSKDDPAVQSLKMTYHSTLYGYPTPTYPVYEEGIHHNVGGDMTATFNNFDLIWDKWKIDWYFNSNIVHQVTKNYYIPSNWNNNKISKYYRANPIKDYNKMVQYLGNSFMVNKYFPDHNFPQRLIFGFGLRPNVSPSDVGLGKTQEMDNLTIWLRADCSTIKNVYSSIFLYGPTNATRSTYEMGRIVNTISGNNIKIPSNHYAIYAATESINLNDGFSVDLDGNFFGFISSCVTAWDHRLIEPSEPEYSFVEDLPDDNESDINEYPVESTFNSLTRHDVILKNMENSFILECSSGNLYEIELYNMQGALVFSKYNNTSNIIEISKDLVAQGIYTAKTVTPAGVNVKKLWIVK